MTYTQKLVKFSANRVWRTYPGGKILDELECKPQSEDTHFPEDWIGSTTRAVNPGREHITEGLSRATVGEQTMDFDALLQLDPAYFLGEQHVA